MLWSVLWIVCPPLGSGPIAAPVPGSTTSGPFDHEPLICPLAESMVSPWCEIVSVTPVGSRAIWAFHAVASADRGGPLGSALYNVVHPGAPLNPLQVILALLIVTPTTLLPVLSPVQPSCGLWITLPRLLWQARLL